MTLATRAGTPAHTTDAPSVSVVIPTFRRDETLLRLVERLAAQDAPPGGFEIIVVDDACGDTVPAAVAAFAASHPDVTVRALPGAARGPATARNIGWRAARGNIIAFIDDDAYPAAHDWLTSGSAALLAGDAAIVAGAVRVPMPAARPTDFQRNVQRLESGEFLTCNAFVRREALELAGGFDERFTVPYREDSDLQYRIEAAGGRIVRCKDAVVVHPAPPGRFAISLRLQRYSMFNALLYRKHPARFRRDLEPRPPLHYYAMIASGAGSVLAAARRHHRLAAALATVWLALEAAFFTKRVRGTSKHPAHLLDMALTSLLIPWLSVYWRLRGALRFRVRFW